MKTGSNQPLNLLWQNGVLLSNAWLTYAHPDLKAKWDAAHQKSAMTAFERGAEAVEGPVSDAFMFGIDGAQVILAERAGIKKQLQTNILSYLKNGKAFAYAFDLNRTLKSEPVEIPEAVWRGRINWEQSKVSFQSLHFKEVRLTTANVRKRVLNVAPVPVVAKTKGRPGIAPDVVAAFKALHQEGKIDVSKSAKFHFPMIREYLQTTHPDRFPTSKKVGSEGIRAHFSPLFNALKKDRKQ